MMAANETYLLNLTYLENRLGELHLKNWWVAEAIGVDRKTVTRWLTGKVKTIKEENLKALAHCLECTPDDLILVDETSVIASKDEQSKAADLIVQENLLQTLTPLGQWPLLESIVKSTMQPNLSLPVMGKLYNLLSICAWRQHQIDKALSFANKALSIGEGIGHRSVMAQAQLNRAIIFAYQGRLANSIDLYEQVIRDQGYIEEERTIAAAHSNLAQEYQTYGDFKKSRALQLEAIKLYARLDAPLNLSIAYCGLGLLETECKNFDAAITAFDESLNYAHKAGYTRGQSAFKIYLADCYSQQGDFSKATLLLEEGLQGMKAQKLDESLNELILGRFYRLQKKYAEAQDVYERGLKIAKEYPLEVAALYTELSHFWMDQKNKNKSEEYKKKAAEIYHEAGAHLRMKM